MGRYFLVCALEVDSNIKNHLQNVRGELLIDLKKKIIISKNVELKGSNLNRMVLK